MHFYWLLKTVAGQFHYIIHCFLINILLTNLFSYFTDILILLHLKMFSLNWRKSDKESESVSGVKHHIYVLLTYRLYLIIKERTHIYSYQQPTNLLFQWTLAPVQSKWIETSCRHWIGFQNLLETMSQEKYWILTAIW